VVLLDQLLLVASKHDVCILIVYNLKILRTNPTKQKKTRGTVSQGIHTVRLKVNQIHAQNTQIKGRRKKLVRKETDIVDLDLKQLDASPNIKKIEAYQR
jgi:hypothetical protein